MTLSISLYSCTTYEINIQFHLEFITIQTEYFNLEKTEKQIINGLEMAIPFYTLKCEQKIGEKSPSIFNSVVNSK